MEIKKTCETCIFRIGETNYICKCEDSDNNTDFVDKEMECERWDGK